MNVSIYATSNDVAIQLAQYIVSVGQAAIAERDRFHLVLSGGRTPEVAYGHLAGIAAEKGLDWTKVELYWGDERMAPPDSPDSNFAMAQRSLLVHISVPSDNVHACDTHFDDAAGAAKSYADVLRAVSTLPIADGYPVFDLILLGLGDDGHTASLFPKHTDSLSSREWVVGTTPGILPPPVDRVTFTYPVINHARVSLFVVAGEAKAAVVRRIFEESPAVEDAPAVGVTGNVQWLLDKAAASLVTVVPA